MSTLRFMIAAMLALTAANSLHAQFGGPSPQICGKQSGNVSCQTYYEDRPVNTYCNGTCASDKCPVEKQLQAVSQADWDQQYAMYTSAEEGENGVEAIANTPKLCYTQAPCKCVEDAEGDGDCYADLFTVFRHEVPRFALGDPCVGTAQQ